MRREVDDIRIPSAVPQLRDGGFVFDETFAAAQGRDCSRLVDDAGQCPSRTIAYHQGAVAVPNARPQTERERAGRWCKRNFEALDQVAVTVVQRGEGNAMQRAMRHDHYALVVREQRGDGTKDRVVD